MRYADHDDYLHDHDPEGTGIFPVIRPGADRSAGHERYAADPPVPYAQPGGYGRPGGYAGPGGYPAGPPPTDTTKQTRVIRQLVDPEEPARERPPRRPARRRPDRWVIAIGSITGAVAVYVAFTTTTVPAKPMPSPFAPATQGAPAHPAAKAPVTCVTPGP